MAVKKRSAFSVICLILGAVLICSAIAYGIYVMVSANNAAADNKEIVSLAEKLMPTPKDAFPDERGNNAMPSSELCGVNIAGIIEMPAYNAKLPLRSSWNAATVKSIPCRYDGSIYDRTLVIGTVDTKGQFDFVADVSVEDRLFLTDMEGDRYSYKVSSIKHFSDFNMGKWQETESDLMLFVKDGFSGEYTVIYFNAK